ncbi:beta-propeller domain-containing protein, partial [Micromonospora zhanjiangensis]
AVLDVPLIAVLGHDSCGAVTATLDARQVDGTARVVVRSAPRLIFPARPDGDDADRIAANRAVIDRSTVADWLPRYQVTAGGRTSTGRVPCERLSRPDEYSGATLVTVLSFDLAATALTDGDPATVLADGNTVYGTAGELYVASDDRWRSFPPAVPEAGPGSRGDAPKVAPANWSAEQRTLIHRFDVSRPGPPRYVTSAKVPGWLINQYALSAWNGHLRVATTTGVTWGPSPTSSSTVYVLSTDGGTLRETGRVTGLGKGERIQSVRFDGPVGYVVTFRQTDPLYTLDLRDPAAPRVTGELKISGYSSYLHPLDGDRLLGIGQEASATGQVRGTQVSLFDVRDPTRPVQLARHQLDSPWSEAEREPHAFLYWPATGLLVVPTGGPSGRPGGVTALRVTDTGITEVGTVNHPAAEASGWDGGSIRRSLVIGGTLWTLSGQALQANDLTTLRPLTWLPLT